MTKLIHFPALTTFLPRIFLLIAPFITEAEAIIPNVAITVLAKGRATFIKVQEISLIKRHEVLSILNNFRQLWFTNLYTGRHIVSKSIFYFCFCLVLITQFFAVKVFLLSFLVIHNVAPVLFFVAGSFFFN